MAYTNVVGGTLRLISFSDLLKKFEEELRPSIEGLLTLPGVDGVVVFENLDFSASEHGLRSAVPFGPGRTFRTIESAAANFLNPETASRRQYPVAYAFRPREPSALEKVAG